MNSNKCRHAKYIRHFATVIPGTVTVIMKHLLHVICSILMTCVMF